MSVRPTIKASGRTKFRRTLDGQKGFLMYELIILSMLMRFPLHGYLLAKIANDKIGPWAKISNGTLYPLLTKLEQAGLITRFIDDASAPIAPRLRTFAITDDGRKRFHQLMLDTSTNLGEYPKFFQYKVGYLDLLLVREQLHLLNHYSSYCEASLLHLKVEAENLTHELAAYHAAHPFRHALVLDQMQHMMRSWEAERAWALHLREHVIAHSEHEEADQLEPRASEVP